MDSFREVEGIIFYLRSKNLLVKYNVIGSKNFIEKYNVLALFYMDFTCQQ